MATEKLKVDYKTKIKPGLLHKLKTIKRASNSD
jgi:hypothetical protein